MTAEMKAAATDELCDSTAAATQPSSIVTRMNFAASPEQVWKGLLFYEEIGGRPPTHLRMLLPVPIRTEGKVSEVGGEAMCLYEGGHLLKRVTRIEPGHFYEFEVAEQALSVGGGRSNAWSATGSTATSCARCDVRSNHSEGSTCLS